MISRLLFCSLCIVTSVSCAPGSERQSELKPVGAETDASPTDRPRFDAARINKAKRDLLKEPNIGDLMHDEAQNKVDWQVGTFGLSAPAFGYADYICGRLAEGGLVDGKTDVRIVDLDNPKAQAGDYQSASLGRVECATRARHRI